MAIVESRDGEQIEVYIVNNTSSTLSLIASKFRLLTSPRQVASCNRPEGARGCSFACEINLIPICNAINGLGEPESGSITLGQMRIRSPLCLPGISSSSQTITIDSPPPDVPLLG